MTAEFKTRIKRILGKRNIHLLKTVRQWGKYAIDRVCGNYGHIKCEKAYSIYSIPHKHVFFGYYDLQQLNSEKDKLLVHVLSKKAVAGRTPVTIAYIDKKSGKFNTIAQSNAWSWQQGARLRWSNVEKGRVYFNNHDDNGYCCELRSLKGELIKRYPWAFYDISPDEKYGLTLNFSRLQRLRPGYGYCNEEDRTKGINYPNYDGITYVDLVTQESSLLVSLKELADLNNLDGSCQGYINHISISPDGSKFIFFFLWTENDYLPWKNCLYCYDFNKRELVLVENAVIVSHYCWLSNNEVFITSISGEYYKYSLDNGKRERLNNRYLCHDGHPSPMGDGSLLTDTYPLKNDYQTVFITDADGNKRSVILEIYSDPRLFEEKRCDTHPRVSKDHDYVTVDSTYRMGERCVVETAI